MPELHAYTGAPGVDSCANSNFFKYATHMVQGGNGDEHAELPTPPCVAALAPLAKKRALAQMRLSGAPIQTNLQRGAGAVPYSQRLCPRGCAAAVDTEQHALFECQATEAARARYWDDLGLDARDMRGLIDKVYQQKDVGQVMDFVCEASNMIPRPTARMSRSRTRDLMEDRVEPGT
jgi:hypothetical protein